MGQRGRRSHPTHVSPQPDRKRPPASLLLRTTLEEEEEEEEGDEDEDEEEQTEEEEEDGVHSAPAGKRRRLDAVREGRPAAPVRMPERLAKVRDTVQQLRLDESSDEDDE